MVLGAIEKKQSEGSGMIGGGTGLWVEILSWVVRGGLLKKMTFEQRLRS